MSAQPGAFLGHYKIISPLGVGSLGGVLQASAAEGGRRARFEREAHGTAALNQPNILTPFDIGEEQGNLSMVTELIEGVSLRDRIQRGEIPVKEMYRIANNDH